MSNLVLRKLIKAGVILLVLLLFAFVYYLVRVLIFVDAFTSAPQSRFDGVCRKLDGISGAEDVVIDHKNAVAYISATDRRAQFYGEPHDGKPDGIYRLNLGNLPSGAAQIEYLAVDGLADFHPHGIDVVVMENGASRLFAVNHGKNGTHSIEIFNVEATRLRHADSISDRRLSSPNDVAAVNTQNFYVTNDHKNSNAFGRVLEDMFRTDEASVFYWNGAEFAEVISGLTLANGIGLSPDGEKLYVSETLDKALRIYHRQDDGSLVFFDKIYLASGLDNIVITSEGNLLIGAHPSLWDFWKHRRNSDALSPSQVILVEPKAEGFGGRVSEIYLNKGDEISGSSSAAQYGRLLFITPAFEDGVLMCEMASPRP